MPKPEVCETEADMNENQELWFWKVYRQKVTQTEIVINLLKFVPW